MASLSQATRAHKSARPSNHEIRRVELPGHDDAFTVLLFGVAVGTIARVNRGGAWECWFGATPIGSESTLADAVARVEVAADLDRGNDRPWDM